MQKRVKRKFKSSYLKKTQEAAGFKIQKIRKEGEKVNYIAVRKRSNES